MNKFLNVRISVEFFNLLHTHPTFQINYKAISPAFFFCQRIANLTDGDNGHESEFHSNAIYNLFRPYFKPEDSDYVKYIAALQDLEIIEVNHSYYHCDQDKEQSFCKAYFVTNKCLDMLNSSNVEYLKALHNNKQVIRRNQKNVSYRMNATSYSDYVLNYIADGFTYCFQNERLWHTAI